MNDLSVPHITKESIFTVIVLCSIFYAVFSFYAFINPIIPYDGDDWQYLGTYRAPFPKWGGWNPTRVLPEVLMPLTGYIAAFCIYPIVHDYILSITLTTSLIISGTITAYMYAIKGGVEKILNLNGFMSTVLSVLFLILHFVFFMSRPQDNMYMFYTFNLTTIFYYLIPDMLNCSLVLIMLKSLDFSATFVSYSNGKKSIFIIAIYFAIFSNLFCSEILGVFCFCMIVIDIFKLIQRKLSIKSFIQRQSVYLVIETLWGLSIFMELFGGRAHMLGGVKTFDFIGAVYSFCSLLRTINGAVLCGILIILFFFVFFLLEKDNLIINNKLLWKNIICLMFCFFPMVFVSLVAAAKSIPSYAGIPNSMYGVFFILLLGITLALGFLVQKFTWVEILMPLLVLFSVVTLMNSKPVAVSNTSQFLSQTCVQIDQALIKQLTDADARGDNQVALHVPVWKGDNWPHSNGTVHALPKTLHRHGILTHSIQTTMVKDEHFFETYGIKIQK
jgi:hypothetical protein